MNIEPLKNVAGVFLLKPKVYIDERGYFTETHRVPELAAVAGLDHLEFVQGNQSLSGAWTLRGLHYQVGAPQGKLMGVSRGSAWVVGLDIRELSPSFGKHIIVKLDDQKHERVWLPPGLAAGFLAGPQGATVTYQCTTLYDDSASRCLRWNDLANGITWPIPQGVTPTISTKDRNHASAKSFEAAEKL